MKPGRPSSPARPALPTSHVRQPATIAHLRRFCAPQPVRVRVEAMVAATTSWLVKVAPPVHGDLGEQPVLDLVKAPG